MTKPKRNMQADSQTCGVNFFNRILEGISKTIYGTKKMVNAVLYCVPVKPKSFCKPNTDALAMLVRSRKARTAWRFRCQQSKTCLKQPSAYQEMEKRRTVHDAEERNDPKINSCDQSPLRRMRRALYLDVVIVFRVRMGDIRIVIIVVVVFTAER